MRVGLAKTWRPVLVTTVAIGLSTVTAAAPAGASPKAAAKTGAVVTTLSTTTYGSVLVVGGDGPLAGAPLYEISSDADGKFGCTTKRFTSYDDGADVPLSCTGPESDLVYAVQSDDWPAFTTTGAPLAGPGINQDLLGSVYRPGVGHQVTYGGHPLYLYDLPSRPFAPQGEGVLETVSPLPPEHGLWDLVSSKRGQPAPGVATIFSETLPDGKTVLAPEEVLSENTAAITAYSFSGDRAGYSACTGACAVTWIPVLTTGRPRVAGDVAAKDVGIIRRPDGTSQVTYDGKPLYLYSSERAIFVIPTGPPEPTGTVGNGNGLPGPDGGRFSVIYLS